MRGWGLFIHLNLLVLLLMTPLRKYFGTILELDKTSWVLNSGLIRNILDFDLVYSQEKTNSVSCFEINSFMNFMKALRKHSW